MKILSAKQIRDIDAYTIEHEPVSSIDLMERASKAFVSCFVKQFDHSRPVFIVCGPGNNGGDGLAVARLLARKDYFVKVFTFRFASQTTADFDTNLLRLQQFGKIEIQEIGENQPLPNALPADAILIDAILGSGLNRPISGIIESIIKTLNRLDCTRVSIDIPSGLFADRHSSGTSIKANQTISFQLPKLAFFFPENHQYIGDWSIVPIDLHLDAIKQAETFYHLIDSELITSLHRKRSKFVHKGKFGHALLVVGSKGMLGAGLLATKASIKSGAGLVTAHIPRHAVSVFQQFIPEAMVSEDEHTDQFTGIRELSKYSAIGVGCGIGTSKATSRALQNIFVAYNKPVVVDADALNILSQINGWERLLPKNSILTPHPKEFERLFGRTDNEFERNELQVMKAQEYGIYIVLKGAHTCIATPGGNSYYNNTGNPGMATAGSGDVLTGIITGLLASGYGSFSASLLGVYLHGLAGDLALEAESYESLLAGDIINELGKAFKQLSTIQLGI